jgi:fructose-1,6-bisphosphatase I
MHHKLSGRQKMASYKKLMTLERFIHEQERLHPSATGEFSALLHDLTVAAKLVWRQVSKAGLVNILGTTKRKNVSGDRVQKLDEFADQTIYGAMDYSGHLCALASEENEGILQIPGRYKSGKYVLLYDPLDGSSNIDANVTVGSIFSIYRRLSKGGGKGNIDDLLQPGVNQAAAGYIIYGSSTVFVYSTGSGVHMFTYDPSVGEFLLSNKKITVPEKGRIYSINEGNYNGWEKGLKKYINYLKEDDKKSGRPYSQRYIGTMVSDVHRTMLYGGIFAYPADRKNPGGKLRLCYECNPIAFMVEQAGGEATDGRKRILEIKPHALHQRTPLFLGSRQDMSVCREFLLGKR